MPLMTCVAAVNNENALLTGVEALLLQCHILNQSSTKGGIKST